MDSFIALAKLIFNFFPFLYVLLWKEDSLLKGTWLSVNDTKLFAVDEEDFFDYRLDELQKGLHCHNFIK